jgi:mono/diheme cytochrome c family protein
MVIAPDKKSVEMEKKPKKENKLVIALVVVIVAVLIGHNRYTGSSDTESIDPVIKGEQFYNMYCVSCHGVKGVGERPEDKYAQDEYGYVAPPMDDTGHAWHHTDEQLVGMILEGSPRNPRMASFKQVLNESDANSLVEYIKSLWSPHIRENCQGPKHMNPGCM